ncbi:MAG: hypothetical protein ISS57_01140 [Anaerolineales bacterium]|nr:hypothetical protein [Anaerolineales bacterium]
MSRLFFLLIFIVSCFTGYYYAFNTFTQEIKPDQPIGNNFQENSRESQSQSSIDKPITYFPRTGHWVSGQFLTQYMSALDSKKLFGAPITDAYFDENNQMYVQYFEKTRFEQYVDENGNTRVEVSPLGTYLYNPGEHLPNHTIGGCKKFPDQGLSVCHNFLDFYETNGGVQQFGFPISEFEIYNHFIVQHFEYARFEWKPELSDEDPVVIANIGYEYFYSHGEDENYLEPLIITGIPTIPEKITAEVFTDKVYLEQQDTILVSIIVTDQYHSSIQDALLVYQVILPDGSSEMVYPGVTNEKGINISEFSIHTNSCGTIIIDVAAGLGDLTTGTKTSAIILCK